MKFSDYAYIPKSQLEYEDVVKNLRVFGVGRDNVQLIQDCWDETDEFWVVPRYWGTQNFQLPNKTTKPRSKWEVAKKFTSRYNQAEVIKEIVSILNNKLGCRLDAKTGYGKTTTCLQIASKLKTRAIVVVDKEDLMGQWQREFETWFGGCVGIVRGDKLDYDCPLTIATAQTLYSRRDTLPKKFWKSFGCLIVDEGHSFPANSFYTAINKFHARYRLACSATWRRKDGFDPLWDLAISDQVVEGIRTDSLERRYFVKEVKFGISHGIFLNRWTKKPDFNLILSFLAENHTYNDMLAQDATTLLAQNRNLFIVCKRVSQLEELHARLSPVFDVGVYSGTFKGKAVKKAEIESAKTKKIILATVSKVEKGLDIKRMDTMMIASPISDQEQIIGRIAREFEGKNFCEVYDYRFPEIIFTNKGNKNRDKLYKKLDWKLHEHYIL